MTKKGEKQSPELIEKRRQAMIRNWNQNPERKKRYALKMTGDQNFAKRPEIRKRISQALTGTLRDDVKGDLNPSKRQEIRRKISLSKLGIPRDSKTIEKMSLGMIRFMENNPDKVGNQYGNGQWYFSTKENTHFWSRSNFERIWFRVFDNDPLILHWYPEPGRIPYLWEGSVHNYKPDAKIRYIDGRTEIIEIKDEREWADLQNQAKWAAARKWCSEQERLTFFRVIGELDLPKKTA